jgi:hypothetical protein
MESEWGAYNLVDIPTYNPGVSASKEVARGLWRGDFGAVQVARSDAFNRRQAFFERCSCIREEGISSRVGGLRAVLGGSTRRVVRVLIAIGMWRIRGSRPRNVLRSAVCGRVNRTHSWVSVGSAVWPNKAPEPTPTAVTPRAIE